MLYKQINNIPEDIIINSINYFLNEDLPDGDKTTDAIFLESDKTVKAELQAKEDLVLCGSNLIKYFFPNALVNLNYKDGEFVKKNNIIAIIKTSTSEILKKERVLLNLIQRMSGISSQTSKFVEKAKSYNVKILDTRKTTPGLRYFEKYAVFCGGGTNHRFDLSSAVMIKDNHIASAGSINKAIELILEKKLGLIIEVEVDFISQIQEVVKYPIDSILLDNFSREDTIKAVEIIKANAKNIFIESSGGIKLSNLDEYLDTGIDAISSGALTHSVICSDISLNII